MGDAADPHRKPRHGRELPLKGRPKMAKPSLSMIARAAKMATIGATKCTGDVAEAVLGAARDILLTAVDGVAQVAIATEKGAVEIVTGAVHAAAEEGGDVMLILEWTIHGMVKSASEVGADIGRTAVAAVAAGIMAAEKVGADARCALRHAVAGAIEAADEADGNAPKVVRAVLRTSIKGAKGVIQDLSRK